MTQPLIYWPAVICLGILLLAIRAAWRHMNAAERLCVPVFGVTIAVLLIVLRPESYLHAQPPKPSTNPAGDLMLAVAFVVGSVVLIRVPIARAGVAGFWIAIALLMALRTLLMVAAAVVG